jgi:L-aspartate oxidase
LVIGSGIAGLYFALHAAEHGTVLIATKNAPEESNTSYAQGGIASVLSAEDSFDAHVADTLTVGDGLCHRDVVELCVREAPGHIRELMERFAVDFDQATDGTLDLGQEGGHSARRVVHSKDFTGRELERALLAACAKRSDRITILRDHMAIDLLEASRYGGQRAVFGAYLLGQTHAGASPGTSRVITAVARATVLATGGAGKVYRYTTNPAVATGDGVALAYRAGAAIANMEFIQFHPTCLYHPDAPSFLISEALRGEGGILKLRSGAAFMERYHEMKSLAPRDVVARAIDAELKRSGDEHVVLDMTHLDPDFLVERFPNIHERCLQLGIDLRRQPIPVVPAAHYVCGGVQVDTVGRSSLSNLYAIGEVACTGLHGACRLASNSLLEALVFAKRAADHAHHRPWQRPPAIPPWVPGDAVSSDEAVVVSHSWGEIRRLMWSYVGIVRSNRRLERAARRIELIRDEIRDYYWKFLVTAELLELRNLALVAHLIIESARRRTESRGLHYTVDYPTHDPSQRHDTVLSRIDGPRP